tara:strand:- start:1760 stop:1960 length:201 start_codon:yes stop_codon:yes gene_type:complete
MVKNKTILVSPVCIRQETKEVFGSGQERHEKRFEMKKIKKFFKDIWLGIKISNEYYLSGKCNHGKF